MSYSNELFQSNIAPILKKIYIIVKLSMTPDKSCFIGKNGSNIAHIDILL